MASTSTRDALLRMTLAVAAACAGAGAAQAQHLVLGPGSGHVVEAQINGIPLRLKVELGHELAVNLNPDIAERAGLTGRRKSKMVIWPIEMSGRSADTMIMISGRHVEASVQWYHRDAAQDADGTISASLLPFETVTLETASPAAAARTVSFSTRIDDKHGIFVPIRAGGETVAVRFTLGRPKTVALAAAGAVIGKAYGGVLEEARTPVDVAFGISRPARALHLEQPLAVGPFTLRTLLVRTADFRGRNKLPKTQYSNDGEAIVVRANLRSQNALYRMTIGTDVLAGCWSATYASASRTLVFRCTP